MRYAIGINGGGSHSRLVAMDESMNVIGRVDGGATNISSHTYDGVLSNIQTLLDEFCKNYGVDLKDCLSICIGSAGATIGENTKLLSQIFQTIGYVGELKIMNDAELVLLAETKNEPGIIVISGTGSVGYAIDKDGEIFRAGGWGHMIDDGGSAYRIGMDAIEAALMDFDGRGEKTALTGLVTEFFGCGVPIEIVGHVYGGEFNKTRIAEIALLVNDAAKRGDDVANKILHKAAKSLVELALALIKRAELDAHKIVLSGSVIIHNEIIRKVFEEALGKAFPEMQIVEISEEAEIGAARLAWHYYKHGGETD